MVPAPKARPDPDERSGFRDASDLMAAQRKAHDEAIKAAVPLAPDLEYALRSDAALKATNCDNIERRFPVAQEHVEIQITQAVPEPPSAIASDEQSLREDLLANDSLGG